MHTCMHSLIVLISCRITIWILIYHITMFYKSEKSLNRFQPMVVNHKRDLVTSKKKKKKKSKKRQKDMTLRWTPQISRCWICDYRMLLLLLISCFSRVWLCATPETATHQAPPSLGFTRQEHWSGLPFPSPMHESEKWKWSCPVVSNS